MLTYVLTAAYAAIAVWFFWLGTGNGATLTRSIIVSLLWPIAVLLLACLLWFGGEDSVPEDA